MATFTVTASLSANDGSQLDLHVLTGAVNNGTGGAAVSTNKTTAITAGTSITQALTPNFTNSLVIWAGENDDNTGTYTAGTNCAIYAQNGFAGNSVSSADGSYTSTVTSGTPVTLAFTHSKAFFGIIAGVEIPPSGGSTPVVDASSPAAVGAASGNLVTASFTPPAGSLLVAVVTADGTSTVPSITMSDTSGLGLTWTGSAILLAATNSTDNCAISVYAAQMPAAASATVFPVFMPSPAWRNRFHPHPRLQLQQPVPAPYVFQDYELEGPAADAGELITVLPVSGETSGPETDAGETELIISPWGQPAVFTRTWLERFRPTFKFAVPLPAVVNFGDTDYSSSQDVDNETVTVFDATGEFSGPETDNTELVTNPAFPGLGTVTLSPTFTARFRHTARPVLPFFLPPAYTDSERCVAHDDARVFPLPSIIVIPAV